MNGRAVGKESGLYGKWNNKGQCVDKEKLENGEQDNQIPVGEAAQSQANLFRSQPLET